jgi:predicted DNA-binding transcriptional regulator AlpA
VTVKQHLPGWPRRMDAALAAAYLGISESWLRAKAGTYYPAPQRDGKLVLWDREALDQWVTAMSRGGTPADQPAMQGSDPVSEAIRAAAGQARP